MLSIWTKVFQLLFLISLSQSESFTVCTTSPNDDVTKKDLQQFKLLENISQKGEKGEKGDRGQVGLNGIKGIKGSKGQKGEQAILRYKNGLFKLNNYLRVMRSCFMQESAKTFFKTLNIIVET